MPKRFVLIGLAVLASCAKPLNPIQLATKCIRDQVPQGKDLSAAKAHEVIARCQSSLDAWSVYSVEGISGKPFNGNDEAAKTNFAKHQQAGQRYWLRQLSAEYADAHPEYD